MTETRAWKGLARMLARKWTDGATELEISVDTGFLLIAYWDDIHSANAKDEFLHFFQYPTERIAVGAFVNLNEAIHDAMQTVGTPLRHRYNMAKSLVAEYNRLKGIAC